jgi:hypothetical protein
MQKHGLAEAPPGAHAMIDIDTHTIKIEKNVPLPHPKGGKKWRALLERLEVGDSALILTDSPSYVANLLLQANRQNRSGKKITTRSVTGGLRVWRLT